MNCPKCEQENLEGAVDCARCGVILARAVAATSRRYGQAPLAQASEPRTGRADAVRFVTVLLIVAGLIIGGTAWTSQRRQAREAVSLEQQGNQMLNDLNQKHVAAKKKKKEQDDRYTAVGQHKGN